jgi:hypothetical protein
MVCDWQVHPDESEVEDESEYEDFVREILAEAKSYGLLLYLIHWQGYGIKE